MYSINALAVVAILGLTRSIFALPQDASAAAAVPADPISKYTVDVSTSDQGRVVVGFVNNIYQFFLNNVKTPPTASSCVFYTTGLTTEAQEFAARQVKFTIWNVWDCSLYDRDQADTNPLRDILKPNAHGSNFPDTQTYFSHMSEAFAALCGGTATLLTDNRNNVDMSGIWGQTEFPTLQKTGNPGGQVNRVDACDENGNGCIKFWTRSSLKRLRRSTIVSRAAVDEPKPEKRQIENCPLCEALPNQCFTPEELGKIFSDVDELW
ncbi:hypothetical protein H2198_007587 [Neophaeococcomyces mojaviensis]|uniref:Uncharacterized protein n=1 Tax=Neophaeococcomyces mojaviensis TaxID=3383035 RepID=A0ACC2ZZM7_9EURO|nr:hypothetical protein H2198_007587 [Knufia sp. JES_112]